MKIAVLKETRAGETRVAASPDTIKKFCGLGAKLAVEVVAILFASTFTTGSLKVKMKLV